MRKAIVWLVALCCGLVQPALTSAEERNSIPLPVIVVGGKKDGPPPTTTNTERCVEVEIGSSRAFNCLNQKLKREVDRVAPTLNLPPIDARSPDTKTGVINIPAVQQQYGKNFGVSATPYRPGPLIYSGPRR